MEDVANLCSQVGPCPSDILKYVKKPQMHLALIEEAAKALKNVTSITDLFTACLYLQESSYRLILVDRNGPLDR